MRHHIRRIRAIVDRHVWWPVGQLSGLVPPLPFLAALAILLVLSSSGQLHEIYAALLEGRFGIYNLVHVVTAAFALTLLSAALYFANYRLSDTTIDIVWVAHRDVDVERRLRLIRNWVGGTVAALPWIGLGLGLREAYGKMKEQVAVLEKTSTILGTSADVRAISPDVDAIVGDLGQATAMLPWILLMVAVAGVVVVLSLHLLRRSTILRYGSDFLVGAMFIAALVFLSCSGTRARLRPSRRSDSSAHSR